jgi:hypothetical protein
MDNLVIQVMLLLIHQAMFMLSILRIIALRSLTAMAHTSHNGALLAIAMGNLILHVVLLSIPLAMFLLPIVAISAFRSLTATETI